jgi:hypothetical protein
VSEPFEKIIVVLLVPFLECHTATYICLVVQDAVSEFDVPPYKAKAMYRDNEPYVVKGILASGNESVILLSSHITTYVQLFYF